MAGAWPDSWAPRSGFSSSDNLMLIAVCRIVSTTR
jgi:hypothetical protein